MSTTDIITIIALVLSSILSVYTVYGELVSARKTAKTQELSASDDIASGAQTIIKLTREELDREQEKRRLLQKQITDLRDTKIVEISDLRDEVEFVNSELDKAITCAQVLHSQLLQIGQEPFSDANRLKRRKQ